MPYIRHESLFTLQDLYKMEQKDRFREIFSTNRHLSSLTIGQENFSLWRSCRSKLQSDDLFLDRQDR